MVVQVQNRSLECRNLHDYLKTLQPEVLDQLYNHPATCLAVFRELPGLAKQFIMRLLHVQQPVPQAVVSSWVTHQFAKESVGSRETLSSLRLWYQTAMPGGLEAWTLNGTFRANLRMALSGGGQPWTMSAYLEPDPKGRDTTFLEQYATERWETVLHYMVASSQQGGISADAVRTLLQAGLMCPDESQDNAPVITRSGFQFLLMERASQVWFFILQYLDSVSSRGMSLVECLSFLFQLSFSQLGKDYSTDGMSQGLVQFLQHLREFGLIYQRKRTSGRFYPTQLALNICSGDREGSEVSLAKDGYIVVETNYRVYAYTDSSLQIALLGLFTEILYRFPNLCVGVITRESSRQAFRGGITGQQIIRFLNQHAHPKCQVSAGPPVPPSITDQILLWEQERDRFLFTEGVLYNQFLSQADYEMVKNYADQRSLVVWSKDEKRTLVVKKEGHDDVKRFWRNHSRGQGGGGGRGEGGGSRRSSPSYIEID